MASFVLVVDDERQACDDELGVARSYPRRGLTRLGAGLVAAVRPRCGRQTAIAHLLPSPPERPESSVARISSARVVRGGGTSRGGPCSPDEVSNLRSSPGVGSAA